MMKDPYAVLGVSRTATQAEKKKAYRKLAKKYHPDLHPGDQAAADKMNEINVAYDMLTHPEKFARQQRYEQAQQSRNAYSQRTGSSYGGSRSSYGNGTYGSYGYSGSGFGQSSSSGGGYSDFGGWYSDFGFDFEDLFGFGRYANRSSKRSYSDSNETVSDFRPGAIGSDSKLVRNIINLINSGSYDAAMLDLNQIQHAQRDARWHYLYSLALYGRGDVSTATDFIIRAIKLDENNLVYRRVYKKLSEQNQTYYGYSQGTRSYSSPFSKIGRFILIFIALQFVMRILAMFMGYTMMAPM